MKAAAIDIGSNAIRLLISEVYEHNKELRNNKLQLVRTPIRLGEDVFANGFISDKKIDLLIKAMQAYKNLIEIYDVKTYRAVATSAMREAKNGHEVAAKVQAQTGVKINIISGDLEANLLNSTYSGLNLDDNKCYLYIDVGGGSTELTLLKGIQKMKSHSFKVGTVRLLQNKVKPRVWDDITHWIQQLEIDSNLTIAVGTGGNINKIVKLLNEKDSLINLTSLQNIFNKLEELTVEERKKNFNLKDDRADVIVPAGKIYLHVMQNAGITNILVPKIGLADGIISSLYIKEVQRTIK